MMIDKKRRDLFIFSLALLLPAPSWAAKRGEGSSKGVKSSVVQKSRANGGHMHKHVSKSRDYLHSRTHSMKGRAVFNAAAHGIIKDANGKGIKYRRPNNKALGHLQKALGKNVNVNKAVGKRLYELKKATASPLRAGAFHNGKTLDRVYASSARANRREIAKWLSNPNGKPDMKIKFREKVPVGHLYSRDPGQRKGRYKASNTGHFTLIRTADGKSFYPLTSMLY